MVGAQCLLRDRKRALVERLGLGVAALGCIEQRQVVERGTDVRVVRAERLLADGERALVERLGLGVAALFAIELGEPIEELGDGGLVLGPCGLLDDGKAALIKRHGFSIATLGLYNSARLLRMPATRGSRGPSTCSRMARARW